MKALILYQNQNVGDYIGGFLLSENWKMEKMFPCCNVRGHRLCGSDGLSGTVIVCCSHWVSTTSSKQQGVFQEPTAILLVIYRDGHRRFQPDNPTMSTLIFFFIHFLVLFLLFILLHIVFVNPSSFDLFYDHLQR